MDDRRNVSAGGLARSLRWLDCGEVRETCCRDDVVTRQARGLFDLAISPLPCLDIHLDPCSVIKPAGGNEEIGWVRQAVKSVHKHMSRNDELIVGSHVESREDISP